MKKLLFSALILSSAFFAGSCTDQTVEKEKVAAEEFDKEKFYSQLRTVPFYISKAYRVVGQDTINVLADPLMALYRDAVYVTFVASSGSGGIGYVQYYAGSIWTNPPFAPPARAFSTNMKFSRPTSMTFNWDETRKTVVITSSGSDEAFHLVPPGKSAYLDTSRFHYNYDFEAAKAGADQSMTWIYDDYTIVMKPMYIFYKFPDDTSWERGIVAF
jgi:hypothetical protein